MAFVNVAGLQHYYCVYPASRLATLTPGAGLPLKVLSMASGCYSDSQAI